MSVKDLAQLRLAGLSSIIKSNLLQKNFMLQYEEVFCIYVYLIFKSSNSEAVSSSCSVKKVFLEILQDSQENTRFRVSFLIKLQG